MWEGPSPNAQKTGGPVSRAPQVHRDAVPASPPRPRGPAALPSAGYTPGQAVDVLRSDGTWVAAVVVGFEDGACVVRFRDAMNQEKEKHIPTGLVTGRLRPAGAGLSPRSATAPGSPPSLSRGLSRSPGAPPPPLAAPPSPVYSHSPRLTAQNLPGLRSAVCGPWLQNWPLAFPPHELCHASSHLRPNPRPTTLCHTEERWFDWEQE